LYSTEIKKYAKKTLSRSKLLEEVVSQELFWLEKKILAGSMLWKLWRRI